MDAIPRDEYLLDPNDSKRQIYRERATLLEREIWRPGDGEGDQGTEYYDRPGPPLPLEKRWRLFQSDIGPMTIKNQPPRFVMLDDRAVYEVLESDIPRAKLSQNWPHEFGGPGKVRTRRAHRGRPAIEDVTADGDAKYHSTITANGKETYFLTGERDYQPVFYRYEPLKPEPKRWKRKRMPSPTSEEYNPRGHGHNQYTPKDMMVKNGAASFSLKEKKTTMPRLNTSFNQSGKVGWAGKSPEKLPHKNEAIGQVDVSEIPANLDRNGRRDFEQGLATRILADIKNDQDMESVAHELSKAHMKTAQQAREIEHLKQALAASASDEDTAHAEAKKANAKVVKHEQKIAQQAAEIATLKKEITAGEGKEEKVQTDVDAVRQGQ